MTPVISFAQNVESLFQFFGFRTLRIFLLDSDFLCFSCRVKSCESCFQLRSFLPSIFSFIPAVVLCMMLLRLNMRGRSPPAGGGGGDSPVVVDDERDGLKQDGVLGVGVLHLLGLGRFLGFVQNGLQTLHQTALDGAIFWWRVTLQQAQQLAGEPRRRDKVVGVVLQVGGG